MQIIIDDKAKEYIRKKSRDNAIKIDIVEVNHC